MSKKFPKISFFHGKTHNSPKGGQNFILVLFKVTKLQSEIINTVTSMPLLIKIRFQCRENAVFESFNFTNVIILFLINFWVCSTGFCLEQSILQFPWEISPVRILKSAGESAFGWPNDWSQRCLNPPYNHTIHWCQNHVMEPFFDGSYVDFDFFSNPVSVMFCNDLVMICTNIAKYLTPVIAINITVLWLFCFVLNNIRLVIKIINKIFPRLVQLALVLHVVMFLFTRGD